MKKTSWDYSKSRRNRKTRVKEKREKKNTKQWREDGKQYAGGSK